jgi:hypothetical protein
VALCAVIWNLSVSGFNGTPHPLIVPARHRTFLINHFVLLALANQLTSKHLLLQREAAGAIRNFSIDRTFPLFALVTFFQVIFMKNSLRTIFWHQFQEHSRGATLTLSLQNVSWQPSTAFP